MRYVRWRAPEVEAVDTIMLGGFGLLLLIPHLILLLIKTRFIIPEIYSLIVDIHFHEWEAAHHVLSNRIEIALIVLVIVSWIVTLIRTIKRRLDNR